jgi:hypothetical protein
MPAERLGATGLDRTQGAILHRGQTVRGQIRRAVAREDLRELYLPCRIRTLRMRTHGTLAALGLRPWQ